MCALNKIVKAVCKKRYVLNGKVFACDKNILCEVVKDKYLIYIV